MSLRWNVQTSPGGEHTVSLHGRITEEADFRPLLELAGEASLHLDLEGVEQINSCGVREWILLTRELDGLPASVQLERCSPAIVRQLNMISNFSGGAPIRSVMLPYYCDACGQEHTHAMSLSDHDTRIEETRSCPHCGELAEFDDLPDAYLLFAEVPV